jgi:hypothetical protein
MAVLTAHSFFVVILSNSLSLLYVPLLQKLSLLNGVLFTGGSVKSGPYFETIKKVFQVR